MQLKLIHDDSRFHQCERLKHFFFFFANTCTYKGLALAHKVLRVKVSWSFFFTLQEVWSEVEEMSCFSSAHWWILLSPKWQQDIVNWRSWGVQGDPTQHFCPAMLPTGEEEKGWNNECESGELCQSVNWVINKIKFLKGAPWKVWNFHQHIKFTCCMEGFCGITFYLNASFPALNLWCEVSAQPWRAI